MGLQGAPACSGFISPRFGLKMAARRSAPARRPSPTRSRVEHEAQHATRLLFPLPSARSSAVAPAVAPRGAAAAAPQRPALTVRVAPSLVQEVVYQIKALGSLEAEEMVQVTAEVEGASSDVRFHEGDRVARRPCCADRPRALPGRGRAGQGQPRAGRGRAGPRPGRPEAPRGARREKLVGGRGADPLARRERAARAPRSRCAGRAAGSRSRTAPLRGPAAARRRDQHPHRGHRPVRPASAPCSRRSWTPAGCACASRSRRASRCGPARTATVTLPRGGARPQDFAATIYHVGEVADPATRQVEVLAWVKNPGELKPGFFAEVTLAGETRKDALVVPEGAIQASERASSPTSWRAARPACGRSRSACAPATGSWRSSPGSSRARRW